MVIAMAYAASATHRIEIASGVLVLPLREPLALAKQIASIDAMSGGRVSLGIGAGWLAEEFEALGVDFASRADRTDDYIAVLRQAWTGHIRDFVGKTYRVQGDVRLNPRPAHDIPIIVGGTSTPALSPCRASWRRMVWIVLRRTNDGTRFRDARHPERKRRAEGRDPSTMRFIASLNRASDAFFKCGQRNDLKSVGVGRDRGASRPRQ